LPQELQHEQRHDSLSTSLARPETLTARDDLVPAQVLLTCHYSHYREYCMNGIHILDPQRMERLATVHCIAVQGGMDRICPPDTALDLWNAWPVHGASSNDDHNADIQPSFELRMPLYAGHSMYDPFLVNELVRSTDRVVDVLNRF